MSMPSKFGVYYITEFNKIASNTSLKKYIYYNHKCFYYKTLEYLLIINYQYQKKYCIKSHKNSK